jgi:hypothetical protein
MFGNPAWSEEDRSTKGAPPLCKLKGEGVSGAILNSGCADVVLIPQVHAENNKYYDQHQNTLRLRSEFSDEYKFVKAIKAEFCVPLPVGGQVIAGIVGVKWHNYSDESAREILAILQKWQDFFSNIYYFARELERRQAIQQRISEYSSILSSLRRPLSNEECLREIATFLTCDAGLSWHRAFVFLFHNAWPADAECELAIGGDGGPSWAEKLKSFSGRTLTQYLQATRDGDYAEEDPLFRLSTLAATKPRIPSTIILEHPKLHRLFAREEMPEGSLVDGLVSLSPNDSWLENLPWYASAFAPECRRIVRYVAPLFRPAVMEPIGFILLDNPYPQPHEAHPNLSGTRLLCETFSGQLADRHFSALKGIKETASTVAKEILNSPVDSASQSSTKPVRSILTPSSRIATSRDDARPEQNCTCNGEENSANGMGIVMEQDAELLEEAMQAFEEDRNRLLKEIPGRWVAFVGKSQVEDAESHAKLLKKCHARGISDAQLFTTQVLPKPDPVYEFWRR